MKAATTMSLNMCQFAIGMDIDLARQPHELATSVELMRVVAMNLTRERSF